MDNIDRKIIALLAEDARQPLAALGAAVGLSASAVNERLRRLTEAGALRAIRADADPAALDLPVRAFVWLALAATADEAAFRAAIAARREVTACHHVTGPWSYLLQIQVADLAEVESFLALLKAEGWLARSETQLALSEVVAPPFRYPGRA
ncbi:MAG: Lrp/AsnC family transcriptional regulator [Alphaproteobacteria bacterium HGW-Alphaproteobacteria-4]|nr:MAG: Lrp/AsnC family transcriptional regulator [Alphaproteobacteria bacterium HGW-Alphaproteobacteria-4]